MATEYSEAKSAASETNPLRLSNLFHIAVGSFNLLVGGIVAFQLTRETDKLGMGLIPSLSIAGALLVLGMTQVARAWRDENFRFRPDDIGGFAVSEKFANAGKPDQAGYLTDVLNNGVQPAATPDSALLNKLYKWLPKLELAPDFIRWHAETQALRIARLVVVTLGFALAWLFAKPLVFAWMAPIYLVLAISPLGVMRNIAGGNAGDDQLVRPAAPTPHGAVGVLLLSIFGPILIGLLPPDLLPTAPYVTSTIVIPTVVAMLSLLAASTFFVLSLKAQTRNLTTSGVGHRIRNDLKFPNISSGLIDSLQSNLPFPRTVLSSNPGWRKDGNFGGHLLVESNHKLNAIPSHGSPLAALTAAWRDKEQSPLVALAGFGALTGLTATVLTFIYTSGSSVTVGLAAISLFAASQFSLFASRGLWNRVDFTSMIYRIGYEGGYQQKQRVAGNVVTGSGTLTETAVHIEHVKMWICVARLESVAFARKGLRYVQSIDLKPQACELLFKEVEDFHGIVNQRKVDAYHDEGFIRKAVEGPHLSADGRQQSEMLTVQPGEGSALTSGVTELP